MAPADGQTWAAGQPITQWHIDKLLVGDPEGKSGLAYDQNMVRDDDGQLYLLYNFAEARHHDVHIMAQRMLDPVTPDPSFAARKILSPEGFRSEDRNPDYIQIVEATNIAKVQDQYVLLYSVGDFALQDGTSNYKLGIAFSDTLVPSEGSTYRKIEIPDPGNIWGNENMGGVEIGYLLQSEQPSWPNYSAEFVVGPGLGNILHLDGQYWLVFHGYRPDDHNVSANMRYTWKMPLDIDVRGDRPMQEWIRPIWPGRQELGEEAPN